MFNCQYCRKEYTRKSAHKRHVILCEIIYAKQLNSKASLKREEKCEEEETTSIPTLTTLYHIVQELAIENKKMREEISELHKHLTKGLKKVNILEWLNTDDPHQPAPTCGPHINERYGTTNDHSYCTRKFPIHYGNSYKSLQSKKQQHVYLQQYALNILEETTIRRIHTTTKTYSFKNIIAVM